MAISPTQLTFDSPKSVIRYMLRYFTDYMKAELLMVVDEESGTDPLGPIDVCKLLHGS